MGYIKTLRQRLLLVTAQISHSFDYASAQDRTIVDYSTKDSDVAYTVFAMNLAEECSEDQLRELFAVSMLCGVRTPFVCVATTKFRENTRCRCDQGCGRIVTSRLMRTSEGGPAGVGYVAFFHEVDALSAIAAVSGRKVRRCDRHLSRWRTPACAAYAWCSAMATRGCRV